MRVAALFVQSRGVYRGLRDVEIWDRPIEAQGRFSFAERDARFYTGPHPVVAHPTVRALVSARGSRGSSLRAQARR